MSKGAIEAIPADVYLTYAGAAINGGSSFYAESAKHSKAVIDNGGYSLFPNYTDMIKPANKNRESSSCRPSSRPRPTAITR
ncbi:hypothetical protein ACQ86N_21290 [Puia sp. P3]|uniref:hypothetical protein n=1 Tax=Puia sp. P3 TaxID=3423952 RepID=UPI003D66FD5B